MNCRHQTAAKPAKAAKAAKATKAAISQRRSMRGLTLIEAAICLAVVTVVISVAAPSFGAARERRHLEGVAAQFETDVQQARSLAVAHGASVRLSFYNTANSSCYVVHTGPASACGCNSAGVAACSAGGKALHSARWGGDVPVRLSSNSASLLFDATKGTVTPTATVKVQSSTGPAIHQIVNIMGRVRSCSPGAGVSGYAAC